MRRRSVLLSVASGALTGALTLGRPHGVAARQETASLADHPLTGDWMAMANRRPSPGSPQVPVPSHYGADGSVLLVFPPTQVGMQGVEFVSPHVGTWEADGERRGHFTTVQPLSDANGAFLGTVTVDGYPEVSADGQTFVDDGSKVMITIRDATGAIVQQMPGAGGPPVTGIRMAPGVPGFPLGTPATSTPAA